MTTQDLSLNVGRIALISFSGTRAAVKANGLPQFEVRIEAFKLAYGVPRYLITPVSGSGSQWVSAERVQIVNGEEKGQ